MASFNKFNSFTEKVAEKSINLQSDTLKLMFTNTLPVATNAVTTDITEITAHNGYSTGGPTVGIATSSQTAGVYKLIASGTVTVTASGGTVGPFRYIVLYDSTSSDLIGWFDYGSALTLADTDSITFTFDGTNGIIKIT